jgi:hypothetical protein
LKKADSLSGKKMSTKKEQKSNSNWLPLPLALAHLILFAIENHCKSGVYEIRD